MKAPDLVPVTLVLIREAQLGWTRALTRLDWWDSGDEVCFEYKWYAPTAEYDSVDGS